MTESPSKKIMEVIPRIMHQIRTEIRQHARAQLTVPQFRILLHLNRETATHKEVAEWIGITPATLTRIIDLLVSRKLVVRKADAKDQRKIHLTITQKGRKLSEQFMKSTEEWLQRRISSLSSGEHELLDAGLGVLDRLFPED